MHVLIYPLENIKLIQKLYIMSTSNPFAIIPHQKKKSRI